KYNAKSYGLVAFASLWACLTLYEIRERRLAISLTIAGWMLVCFAALSGNIPVARVFNPNRYAPTAYLMMVVPAAMGIGQMISRAKQRGTDWELRANIVALILAGVVTVFCLNEVGREVSYADVGHYGQTPPEVSSLGPYSRWITEWLQQNTTTSGRVLFE